MGVRDSTKAEVNAGDYLIPSGNQVVSVGLRRVLTVVRVFAGRRLGKRHFPRYPPQNGTATHGILGPPNQPKKELGLIYNISSHKHVI